ncbi:hypothetical protein F5Y19DRAFT_94147 [Xylariaceae sp. FL1651]|nr:hypothetical protein F5Y19DRAFT_94147 [Xylariaceae sp. FL1651]
MFQTLKARRGVSGDSEYIVQFAGPPFEKSKTKKQHACRLCKLKKLKCIAEANSCMKCLKQGLECSYSSTPVKGLSSDSTLSAVTPEAGNQVLPSTNNPSKAESSADGNPSSPAHGELAFSDGFGFPDLRDCGNCFDFSDLSNDGMDIDDMNTCLTTSNGGGNHGSHNDTVFPLTEGSKFTSEFLLDSPCGEGNGPAEDPSISPTESSQTTSTFVAHSSSWGPNIMQESQAPLPAPLSEITPRDEVPLLDISKAELQEKKPQRPLPTVCHCLDQIMSANEIMQVKLVWGASPQKGLAVSVDDMLQCQKDVLGSCEALLECSKCSLRSDYVMLIVSMCHEMMTGIGDLVAITLSGSQNRSSKRSRSDASGDRSNSVPRELKAGGWRLDDEDEMQVIRCLIGIRITRLGSLISQLEKAVNANHSAYKWIVRALRQVVTEKIIAIGSARDGVVFSLN